LNVEQSLKPWVTLSLDGKKREFILDTGANDTCIDERLGKQLGLAVDRSIRGFRSGVHSTARVNAVFRVKTLGLGPVTLTDHVVWPLGTERWIASAERTGLLGMDILSRYKSVIDLRSEKLHLVPRTDEHSVDRLRMRVNRWGDALPRCAGPAGPSFADCVKVSPVKKLVRRGRERDGFELELLAPVKRPTRLVMAVTGPDGKMLPSTYFVRMVVNPTAVPGKKYEITLPNPPIPLPGSTWRPEPPFAVGMGIQPVDASPFAEPCFTNVCTGWQMR
jgi:hypothetical protein